MRVQVPPPPLINIYMAFEHIRLDELGRIIYKFVRFVGYTEEWWFSYDSQSNKTTDKYIKEQKPY